MQNVNRDRCANCACMAMCSKSHDTGKKCNEYLIEYGLLLDALGNAQNKLNTNISFVFESVMDFAE